MFVSTSGVFDDRTGVERARRPCWTATEDEYDYADTATRIGMLLGLPLDECVEELVLAEFAKHGVACSGGVVLQEQQCCAPALFVNRATAASRAVQPNALPACIFCGSPGLGCGQRCDESLEAFTLVRRGERRKRENFFREQALA